MKSNSGIAPSGIDWDPDGVVAKDDQGRITVTFKRFYAHPVEHVWQAITDPARTRNWLGRFKFEPKVGGKLSMILSGQDPENGTVTHGEVLQIDPPNLLEYWIHAQDGNVVRTDKHVNRWQLSPMVSGSGAGCLLEFTNTFAPGERARNSILCGWHEMLEKVEDTVEGRETDWNAYTRERIEELYWHYRNKPRPIQPD